MDTTRVTVRTTDTGCERTRELMITLLVDAHRDGMIETVKSLLFRETSGGMIHECRHCGTGVDGTTTTCPCCGHEEIATIHTR